MTSSAILAMVQWTPLRCWQLRDDACSSRQVQIHWRLYKENGDTQFSMQKSRHKCRLYPKEQWISFPRWQFISELPATVRGGFESLMGSCRVGDIRIFLKTSAPLSLIKVFRMNLILAWSISLDNIFDSVFFMFMLVKTTNSSNVNP